jgi:hypothetical protein
MPSIGNQAIQNTEGKLTIDFIAPSYLTNSSETRKTKLKRVKNRDKRLPSARVDKDNFYFENSLSAHPTHSSNSLRRKRKMFDNKLSLGDREESKTLK